MLKNRKSRKPSQQNPSKSNNKRYLILTYAVEFDRVHYPLPLQFEDKPDVASLQRTIQRLRRDLEDSRRDTSLKAGGDGADSQKLRTQCERLRREKVELESAYDALEQETLDVRHDLQAAHDAMGDMSDSDPRRAKKQNARLEEELSKTKRALTKKTRENDQLIDELEKTR